MLLQVAQKSASFFLVGHAAEVEFDDFFQIGEAFLQMGQVFDDALVAVPPVLVFKEEDGAVGAEGFLHLQPIVEVGLAAGVGEEDVDGAFAEEELMGGVVDRLAAEVPDVGRCCR